jgi:hypothetical protein
MVQGECVRKLSMAYVDREEECYGVVVQGECVREIRLRLSGKHIGSYVVYRKTQNHTILQFYPQFLWRAESMHPARCGISENSKLKTNY